MDPALQAPEEHPDRHLCQLVLAQLRSPQLHLLPSRSRSRLLLQEARRPRAQVPVRRLPTPCRNSGGLPPFLPGRWLPPTGPRVLLNRPLIRLAERILLTRPMSSSKAHQPAKCVLDYVYIWDCRTFSFNSRNVFTDSNQRYTMSWSDYPDIAVSFSTDCPCPLVIVTTTPYSLTIYLCK